MPFAALVGAPYNLPYGSSIFARVTASNSYGSSITSDAANGAIILDVPSVVTVVNQAAGTSASKITIEWSEPAVEGGTPVIDYEIYYALPLEDYQVLASGVTDLTYTVEPLSTGLQYQFKVRARNAEGFGDFSPAVTILTAQIPDTPAAPTTAFTAQDTVVVTWTAPSDNGSAL